jgi:hypothetical protein
MTFLVHAALPGSFTALLFRDWRFRWYAVGVFSFIGLGPDIGGFWAYITKDWTLYNTLHFWTVPLWSYVVMWPYVLHQYIDGIVHFPTGQWWPQWWFLEVSLWVVTSLFAWLALKREEG